MKITNLLAIFNHFGLAHQTGKLQEECTELAEALDIGTKVFTGDPNRAIDTPGIVTEMADVAVMLAQFKYAMPELWADVEAEANAKIERTLKRIKIGYYPTIGKVT